MNLWKTNQWRDAHLKKCKYKEVTKMQVSEAGGFGGRWCLIAARCLFSSASCRGRAEVGDTRLQ